MEEVKPSVPQWITNISALARPVGIILMFLLITIFPLVFAIIEIMFSGTGNRIAATIAGFFQAIPEIFYETLQIMFIAYVAGKSAERVANNIGNRRGAPVVQADEATVDVDVSR